MRVSAAKADCPTAAPSRETTYARTLHRACLILGGARELAHHLGVPEASLQNWLEGRDDPPQMVFLAAVEIVLLHVDKSGASNYRRRARMAASVYSRALRRAAALLGGKEKLARVLQVPAAELELWITDRAKPPREMFLRIVDLILDETAPSGDDGPQEPPPREAAGPSRYLD